MDEAKLSRIPPHDIEAEQSVLGSMIIDHEAIVAAAEILRETIFTGLTISRFMKRAWIYLMIILL